MANLCHTISIERRCKISGFDIGGVDGGILDAAAELKSYR